MKNYPAAWTIPQQAFFAGKLTGHISQGEIQAAIDAANAHARGHEAFYSLLIAYLEPDFTSATWTRLIADCERLFK